MSYHLPLMLKHLKQQDLLREIRKLQELKIRSLPHTMVYGLRDFRSAFGHENFMEDMAEDKQDIIDMSTLKLFYWESYNLLGMIGDPKYHGSEFGRHFATAVMFQNQSDQDYDYEVWYPIVLFRNILHEIDPSMSEEKQYDVRTETYHDIEKMLKIKEIVYGPMPDDVFRLDVIALPEPILEKNIVRKYASLHEKIRKAREQT